jgi:uncharacterized protein (DUF2249 family)
MTTLIDGRDLVPPEPLELTLAALEQLPDGAELTLLLYCQPNPLFAILRRDGWSWSETVQPDGTHEIRIRRPAAP